MKNKYWVIPIINVDGSTVILEEFKKTGKLIYKRKNNNRKLELIQGNAQCELWQQGVDINRNYGFNWGNKETVCSDAFPGAHPFSESESRAIRDLFDANKENIVFAYNFHSYGPMYIWPYNS